MPPLAFILLTYARTEYALRTVQGIHKHLKYDGDLVWIVADDGSPADHLNAVLTAVGPCQYRTARRGYGANANWAWQAASDTGCTVTLWLEDDWELRHDWNITPYVRLLQERSDVGIVRLGHMPINLNLSSHGWDGRMYLEVLKDRQYAFSGNPHLKHSRVMVKYREGQNPGDTEVAYDHDYRNANAPAIWWPLAIGDTFPFAHIGDVKSYA